VIKETITKTLGELPLAGRALRWYANQYAEGSVVTIRQGLGTDFLWKRYHRYVNGYWIGHYEFPIQNALKRFLRRGDTFFDIGANAGFFTLIASRLVGETGKCIAFDPSPDNATSILTQIKLNSLTGCSAVMEAIADFEGQADFFFASAGSPIGHLGPSVNGEQRIEVKVSTLDSAVRRFGEPNFVKMDIEGAEGRALRGASRVVNEIRPTWLIELHGAECEREVRTILGAASYLFLNLNGEPVLPDRALPGHFIAAPSA